MHGGRNACYVNGEGIIDDPPVNPAGPEARGPVQSSLLKFGRLFREQPKPDDDERKAMEAKLIELGECMNDPTTCGQPPVKKQADESDIPSGYTYLGQFLAHEITFDDSNDTLGPGIDPNNLRTPQIDFDSLYGGRNNPPHGKYRYRDLYEADGVTLKIGKTFIVTPPGGLQPFPNDLPRIGKDLPLDPADPDYESRVAAIKENPKLALVGDPRNDENLAVAQTNVAFIRFHNRVVAQLKEEQHPADNLFECARREVVRHFQWLILYDYLPRLVDKAVLKRVMHSRARFFKNKALDANGRPTMPLEFSAAAFRIGHTMVRASYEWNTYHNSESIFGGSAARVHKLFEQTGFRRPRGAQFDERADGFSTLASLDDDKMPLRLPSDWIIDWRRFYEFPQASGAQQPRVNRASKLDTVLNFQLDKLQGFPDALKEKAEKAIKAITVRNLLRGYYLRLPPGEEVARVLMKKGLLKKEEVLDSKQITKGPHEALLSDKLLSGKTPLWYYILKEAELLGTGLDGTGGHRLGPVGSRIVAETLVGLIKQTPGSILNEPGWRPRFGPHAQNGEPVKFEMTDLLNFAFDGDINPLG